MGSQAEPNKTDLHVGRRILIRRQELGMSQGDLGKAVGVSFQQIQKYEKGINRIGGRSLQAVATALQVPAGYFFFEGAPGSESAPSNAAPSFVDEFLADKRGIKLAGLFAELTASQRDVLISVAETLLKNSSKKGE